METSETSTGSGFVATADNGQPLVSIVVPAFNEAARIGESVQKIVDFIRRSPIPFEVIIVDDGSIDETAEIVGRFHLKALRLLRNHQNHGKGYSVRQGVLHATGTYVLFTDADLSAPIDELAKLLDVARGEDADVVIGSRAVDRTTIEKHQNLFREVGGIAFNKTVRLLLGLNLKD